MGSHEKAWQELHGSKQWEGLLEPLNEGLREIILRYGDLCQATYDAFNSDPHSKYCGSSRCGKRSFFTKVGLAPPHVSNTAESSDAASGTDYRVAGFLYGTAKIDIPASFLLHSLSREAWSRESNWIGYVAISSDTFSQNLGRRDIVVAYRGTIRDLEWMNVFSPSLESIASLLPPSEDFDDDSPLKHRFERFLGRGEDDDEPKVMDGWYTIYTSDDPKSPFTKTSARVQLFSKIRELVERYKDEELSITMVGHSLGACLAILSSFDVVANGLNMVGSKPPFPVTAFVFGSPGVGNKEFNDRVKSLPSLRVLHVKNAIDLIPLYPGKFLDYEKTGVDLVVDTRASPYLKDSLNPSDWHNLQALIHVVAGWEGKKGFSLKVPRSVALVNKSCDFLKDECLVPASWWMEKNKGMVRGEGGDWYLSPPIDDDIPLPE